jgi:FeS assembly SUF system protein
MTKEDIVFALKSVYDPEIPVNVYDLGLIYDIKIGDDDSVKIKMTLTTPNCPEAESLPIKVEDTVKRMCHTQTAEVEIVWEPSWTPQMMSEAARLELGYI